MDTKDRIARYLSIGLAQSVVASAVGVSESYVSQLLRDEEFAKKVAVGAVERIEKNYKRDDVIDDLEDKFLEKLRTSLDHIYKPSEVLNGLRIINAMQRRSRDQASGAPQTSVVIEKMVVLQLPKQTINNFTLNSVNEVIAIGEQALVAMPTNQLMKEIKSEPAPPAPRLENKRVDEAVITIDQI